VHFDDILWAVQHYFSVTLLSGALALSLAGCGGSPAGGASTPVVPSAARAAIGPDSDAGTPVSGFGASGNPVYAVSDDARTKWTVMSSRDSALYDIPVEGATDTQPRAVSGKYVVGDYDAADGTHGVIVAARSASGVVTVARYPNLGFSRCDGGKALVYDWTADGGTVPYSLLDLATGALTSEALPSGAEPFAMRGKYVLCSVGRSRGRTVPGKRRQSRSPGGMLVFDLSAGTSANLQAPDDSDGEVYAYVLNSKGQVLGVTYQGERTDMRLWDKSGVPGAALDSVTSGYLEPGWISEDARRLSYDKVVGGVGKAYMQVGTVVYLLGDDAFALSSLYGLNPKGTVGFGFDSDLGETVTVGISYR
jgi:hypothetical protein